MADRGRVKVTYYLLREEAEYIKSMADYLYREKAIPRPTLGTYSRAAALKVYQEIYDRLLGQQKSI